MRASIVAVRATTTRPLISVSVDTAIDHISDFHVAWDCNIIYAETGIQMTQEKKIQFIFITNNYKLWKAYRLTSIRIQYKNNLFSHNIVALWLRNL